MINPFYFTVRVSNVVYNINLDSHHINHINSKITINSNHLEIEKILFNEIVKQMSNLYAVFLNHCTFKYQTVFPVRFDEQDEDDQVLDENESYNNLTFY